MRAVSVVVLHVVLMVGYLFYLMYKPLTAVWVGLGSWPMIVCMAVSALFAVYTVRERYTYRPDLPRDHPVVKNQARYILPRVNHYGMTFVQFCIGTAALIFSQEYLSDKALAARTGVSQVCAVSGVSGHEGAYNSVRISATLMCSDGKSYEFSGDNSAILLWNNRSPLTCVTYAKGLIGCARGAR
jgi:hypothetical protein